jgi:DNA-binding transcriptional MerR regulator
MTPQPDVPRTTDLGQEAQLGERFRLDELARRANVPTTTVRLYRTRGLLPPPHLDGRTGWYDESHLGRLRLIARLQQQGHSLAGIGDLIDQWEHGRDLDAIIGVEAGLDALLGDPHAVTFRAEELAERFPPGALTPGAMRRAVELGLVEVADDGTLHVPDRRFVDTGSALAHLGVPVAEVLDDWEALASRTDEIAALFVRRFDERLAPADWSAGLDSDGTRELASVLARLRQTAHQVVAAAFDASLARAGRARLGQLLEAAAKPDGE